MRGWTSPCSSFRLAPARVSREALPASAEPAGASGDPSPRCRRVGAIREISQDKGGAERRHEPDELVDVHQSGPGFDLRDANLADPQLLAQLSLGETALLAQGAEMRPELICQSDGIVHGLLGPRKYRISAMTDVFIISALGDEQSIGRSDINAAQPRDAMPQSLAGSAGVRAARETMSTLMRSSRACSASLTPPALTSQRSGVGFPVRLTAKGSG